MRLWVLSDLHVELTHGWDLPPPNARPQFDVMVMAGDLIPRMERGVKWLLERVQDRPIIYISGNHEFYGADFDRTIEKARTLAIGTNIHVLENDTVVIDGVRFIAATLWTDFAAFGNPDTAMLAAANNMNDYRRIRTSNYGRRIRPIDTLRRHEASRKFIDSELVKSHEGATVVVTHHGPDLQAAKPGHETDILTAAYVSDLSETIVRTSPDLWIYGHTHCTDNRMLGGTRIISNAKGYGPYAPFGLSDFENFEFDPMLTIEV